MSWLMPCLLSVKLKTFLHPTDMNANEMADLMILFDSGRIYEHSVEIATMLRQQQAEIEALKAQILMWENVDVAPEVMADIIVELEKRGFIEKVQEK
jgi:enterochelin esterase-like enzyme